MKLDLSSQQAAELEQLLQVTLRELSHEIADTDNAAYRRDLNLRRQALVEVAAALEAGGAARAGEPELLREISHPGG